MDLSHAEQMVAELQREHEALTTERSELQARSNEVERKLLEADNLRIALEQYLTARTSHATASVLNMGAPPGYTVPGPVIEALPDRSQKLVAILNTGPRDWHLDSVIAEMSRNGWLEGLKTPREAIRIALDRMGPRIVVRIAPATYALRGRLGETAHHQRDIMEHAG